MGTRHALIVGAGIGGLAAGAALRRAGWSVRVFEAASELRAVGFALSLAPNAMQALRELGADERVRSEGTVLRRGELRLGDGRVLKRFNLPAEAARPSSVFALRHVLHRTLLEVVGAEAVSAGHEAVGFSADAARVSVEFKNGHSESGDILIGADGIVSRVRQQLHPDEPPPVPSGFVAIRGVAYDAGSSLGNLSLVGYLGRGIEAGTIRAGADAVYWYASLLREDLPRLATSAALLQHCKALLDHGFAAIVDATRSDAVRVDELLHRRPVERWGRGRVTLLGDAAHPMLPHTGQGAAQALEDAVALGLALCSRGDVEARLRRYEDVRSARTRRLVARGPRIARITTTKSPVVRFLRAAIVRLVPARAVASSFLLSGSVDPHRALR